MNDAGYQWSIRAGSDGWAWTLADRDTAQILVTGMAESRSIAAAMVVRAIARGMTEGASMQERAA